MSLLTAVAALLAVGALVVGGSVAGGLAGRGLVVVVAIASAAFIGLGLVIGWRPALAVSLGLGLVAGIALPSDTVPWAAAAVLGAAVAVGHEAGRLSIDLRRPSRLGPRVLGRLLATGAAVAAVAPATALAGVVLPDRNLPGLLVPVALILAAVPVAAPALAGGGVAGAPPHSPHQAPSGGGAGGRASGPAAAARALASLPPAVRLVLAGLAAAAVLVTAVLGAAARDELPSSTGPGATASHTATTDPIPEAPTGGAPAAAADDGGPPRGRGSIVTIALVTLVAGVIVLLLSGLRRNRIPLVQDPVDVGSDEPGLAIVGASEAVLDDEDVVLADDVAAALVADITVDLRSEPDPGRAVRYAYARVEQRLAALGIERRPAESEPELLGRALGVLGDEGRALADLTALFERARFSDEPVPEALRVGALGALEQLRARLEPAR
ncbi:MAG: DUF4129 domain-containing protein [Acidimicrobiia bacterium]|nr:DUF4129 domain-containing protein [Acidimicrobiia bacterium]MDH5288748.1 DUF4129 domain-containing protein [Acidimicrobiia bacterium]